MSEKYDSVLHQFIATILAYGKVLGVLELFSGVAISKEQTSRRPNNRISEFIVIVSFSSGKIQFVSFDFSARYSLLVTFASKEKVKVCIKIQIPLLSYLMK